MYKLSLNNFANSPVIIIRDEEKAYDFFNPKILRYKSEVDFEIDNLEKQAHNIQETLKDLLILRSELKE